jgi:LmbE family N-acetylglucosaminyl deacetylase
LKKIVIFSPHPDDELIGAGGSMLKWKSEGHQVHVIYMSDGRAAYTFERANDNLIEAEETKISEKELAEIRMQEIDEVTKYLNIPNEHVHKFKFPDQKVGDFIDAGVEQCKPIIKDVHRIVIPSDHNSHVDHQATFDIAVRASQELNLHEIEFYVYAVYLGIDAPKNHKVRVEIKEYNDKVYEALRLYESQKYIKTVKAIFKRKKHQKWEQFGVFSLKDLGKFKNF